MLLWGWTLLTVLVVSSVPLSRMMIGRYTGAKILVRPWMVTYNNVMLGAHLMVLCVAIAGGVLWGRSLGPGVARWFSRGAALLWAITVVAVAALLAFPYAVGPGPWPADSTQIDAMRLLVFLPSVTRTVGWALLAAALMMAYDGRMWRSGCFVLLGLVAADLALVSWKWLITPKAVIALIHAQAVAPVCLVPWVAASVLFVLMLRVRAP